MQGARPMIHRMIAVWLPQANDCVQECLDSRDLPCRNSPVLDDSIERFAINTAPATFRASAAGRVGPNERTNPTTVV
jgi:hypothetical protein